MATVDQLRAGDERAFIELVRAWHRPMLHVAMAHTPTRAVAEEVVQETWLAVLEGLDRFEERSSLKTWVFRILMNRAITRGRRERRTVPFSTLAAAEAELDERPVDPDRFIPADAERYPNHWMPAPLRPAPWPQREVEARETLRRLQAAIDELPPAQRAVITLRDVEGWSPEEVCAILDVSDGNQRVLLHRARSKVREALAGYLERTPV